MNAPAFVPTNAPALNPSASTVPSLSVRPAAAAPVLPPRAPALVSAPALRTDLLPARAAAGHLGDAAVGKGTGTIVVLFRSDLRLDDHPALSHAIEEAATVVPVYCFDPRHFGRTEYGFEKTGQYRAKFLLESIAGLRKSLQEKGADIVVRRGNPEDVLPDLCKKLGSKRVFVHKEVTYDDQQVEAALATALKKQGAELSSFWANTLYHEDDLPFDIRTMPDVYSDFRESVEKRGNIRVPLPAPDRMPNMPKGLRPGKIPTLEALGIRTNIVYSTRPPSATGVSAVTGGEKEAHRRVQAYVEETNRFDAKHSPKSVTPKNLGADFSCRISPWLALGCVSPRRIFDEMKKAIRNPQELMRSSTYFELVWRDFFRCITAKYSSKRALAKSSRSGIESARTTRRASLVGA
ncbi:unnamed protein product [Chondrus crispus]|uniref:Photolyase/cryptochrome alpha/beta domain-containing protein n=1 Tax=Chondrus crispus TaxID=2769 RepID=R7QID9_CHOCR|nr:unnamed protein product [Chondrus crispus]CDF37246.1 unnamed protein product [Chondrus crispus]|eukprot:XP_005717065.1 unnamed protein product [Chondrus crispus]